MQPRPFWIVKMQSRPFRTVKRPSRPFWTVRMQSRPLWIVKCNPDRYGPWKCNPDRNRPWTFYPDQMFPQNIQTVTVPSNTVLNTASRPLRTVNVLFDMVTVILFQSNILYRDRTVTYGIEKTIPTVILHSRKIGTWTALDICTMIHCIFDAMCTVPVYYCICSLVALVTYTWWK